MIYGYIRVSTDKQTVENQRFEILEFAKRNSLVLDSWIEETVSGTIRPENRALGKLLDSIQKDDLIICSELSRLGRSLFMIMSILNKLMEKGARIWTIKDGYRLGDDIQSKVLAFAFGLSAEIERNLISQRTKEALERKKAEGQKLGRPKGSTTETSKLDGAEIGATIMIMQGISVNQMAKLYGVHRNTVKKFIAAKQLGSQENIEQMLKIIG
ncbi:MAG: master DNA invertase Mpi family serine-type recombinase [Treponema sp.]|uniref:Site-specific DNA recombinase n=1 Tax=Treponema porcinum TaxID=261392 RepID=A0A1T4JZR4_TREPO|nr:master DNA invertase Mpi family serine-type recombinase [Treponema porcinum]SJZ35624.1 Site-specific DNA recombinase [Treponema porcinum]